MARKSDVAVMLDHMTREELHSHCEHFGVRPARRVEETRERLESAIGDDVELLVNDQSCWTLESWKDWAEENFEVPRRRSWSEQADEIQLALRSLSEDEDGDESQVFELGEFSVAALRETPALAKALADDLGVSVRTLLRRVEGVHGRTLLTNALEEIDPEGVLSEDDDEDEDHEDDEVEDTDDAKELDWRDFSVSFLRETPALAKALADDLGVSPRTLLRRVEGIHGRTLLGNALEAIDPGGVLSPEDEYKEDGDRRGERDALAAPRRGDSIRALVIGNQRYQSEPLNNPEKDARDFAGLLRQLGHHVELHTDLRLREMDNAVTSFARKVKPDDGVLFYYSGHGAECNDENWLIPIDCESESDEELQRQAKSLNQVLKSLRRARFRITILDACRNHPFRGLSRGEGDKGLAQMSAPHDTLEGDLICYATAPKAVALDGRAGSNGLFTAALLKHLRDPAASIGEMMRRVRREVKEATRNRQTPWESSSLTTDWYPARVRQR